MNRENFLNYKGLRWCWISLAILMFFVLWYLLDDTPGGPNGGTLLGITAGTVSAIIMVILIWFARRKRDYHSRLGTLRGWLSAHVWLGTILLLLVPLHSGFKFGFNIHGLTYFLLLGVVFSGFYGVYVYLRYPFLAESHRGGGSLKTVQEELLLIEKKLEHEALDKSDAVVGILSEQDCHLPVGYWSLLFSAAPAELDSAHGAKYLSKISPDEVPAAERLLSLLSKKRSLIARLQRETRIFFAMQIWLYIHVPLASALILAVALHIGIVLLMW